MRSRSSLSRRGVLLIAVISPALLGSQVRCVFVSNPTVATARIERIEPVRPLVGEVVQFSGTGSGTPPLQFAWDFGDGSTVDVGMQAAHAYVAPGDYRIAFTVRDANGDVARDAAQIVVEPRLPLVPTMSLILVSDAIAGRPVQFAAISLEEDAGGVNYLWTFSDGQSMFGPRAVATFPVAGMYSASITASDDVGATAVAQITFHVN
jgi:PKD repeat protein